MQYSLLDFVRGEGEKAGSWYFSDFGEALIYALIGFVIVFVGITIIIAIIWFIGFLMRKTDNFAFITKRKEHKKEGEEIAATPVKDTDDGEIPPEVKAVIAAAITAYYTEAKPQCEFKVKRIKRVKEN